MDVSFVVFYSAGGAIVMLFLEPLIWLPAAIIGRNSPRRARFWLELPIGLIAACFIGWRENGFASMTGLNATVKAIQFVRPAIAELLAALLTSLVWKLIRAAFAEYNSRKSQV